MDTFPSYLQDAKPIWTLLGLTEAEYYKRFPPIPRDDSKPQETKEVPLKK